jgi:hypothetical protein
MNYLLILNCENMLLDSRVITDLYLDMMITISISQNTVV